MKNKFTLLVTIAATAISLCISTSTNAQTNFIWDKIDSTFKTKEQLFSDTKMFIAENWKSAQDVIQNEDKDAGIIVVKGATIVEIGTGLPFNPLRSYTYKYICTFMIKDNKFRIKMNDVYCSFATNNGMGNITEITPLQPFEGENYSKSMYETKNKKKEIMSILRSQLQHTIDNYINAMKKEYGSTEDW